MTRTSPFSSERSQRTKDWACRGRRPGKDALRNALAKASICSVLASCTAEMDVDQKVHPNHSYLPQYEIPAESLDRPGGPVVTVRRNVERPARDGFPLGALEQPQAETFGRVSEALLTGATMWVLDEQVDRLAIFLEGAPVHRNHVDGRARIGQGRLVALDVADKGALVIFDVAGRVTSYRLRPDGSPHLAESVVTNLGADVSVIDGCMLNGHVLVHGQISGAPEMIHVFEKSGSLVRSFGRFYESGHGIIDHQLSRGEIACNDQSGLVLHVAEHLPVLSAFSLEGDLMWWSEIQDFEPVQLVAVSPRASRMTGTDHVSTIRALVASRDRPEAILQVGHRLVPDRVKPIQVTTLLIDLGRRRASLVDTKGWVARPSDLAGDTIVMISEEPYPTVEVVHLVRTQP